MTSNILIVDDDKQILHMLETFINSKLPSCNCILFSKANETLYDCIKTKSIDLVICDVTIKNIDITNFARFVYKHTKSVILFISGHNYDFDYFNNKLGSSCIYDFMEKPFIMDGFISRIKALINVSKSSRQINTALDIAENKLVAITENSSDVIIILDDQRNIKYANSSINRFALCDSPEDIYNINFTEFCGDVHSCDQFKKIFEECINYPEKSFLLPTFKIKYSNGDLKTFDCRLTNMIHTKGIEGIIVNARETTTESNLRNSIWNIFNYLNFIVVILDTNMKIVLANHFLAQFLGYESEFDLIGKDWKPFLHTDECKLISHMHSKLLTESNYEEYNEFINHLKNKDGEYIEIRWFNYPVINGITGTFSIGIVGNQLESVESMRAYWRDVIKNDKVTIKAMKSMFMQKESERTKEC